MKRSFERDRRQSSSRRQRCTVIITADSTCAMTLAIATPSAAMWHFMTKNRFSITFSMPDIVRYSSGLFVSPAALSTPLPKLYTAIAGMPSAYMLKYSTAPSSSSSFVRSSTNMSLAKTQHIRHSSTPAAAQMMKEVWMFFSVLSLSSAPSERATSTFTPLPSPIKKPVKSVTSCVVEPTAPSAR